MAKRGEIFRTVEMQRLPYNSFDLSYQNKLSFKMGWLIPNYLTECLPGDRFNLSCNQFLRMAPMVSPVMHQVDVYQHYFFVPNRILWDGWEDFITGNVSEASRPAFPTVQLPTIAPGSLADYMGLPHGTDLPNVSAIPFAGFQAVFNDYYRDENLVAEVDYKLANGDNTANWTNLGSMRRRAWQHDYFTSALPFAQKGAPVRMPFGDATAPVTYNTFGTLTPDGDGYVNLPSTDPNVFQLTPGATPAAFGVKVKDLGDPIAGYLYADLSEAVGGPTINEMRNSIALQTWLETNARGGTRYFESMQAHFNVRSPDSRLQRPEYIGGTKNAMVISEVLQTSSTDSETPQGNMAGHGISVGKGGNFSYFCQEHGYIIGIMSVMPRTAYQQGIARHWSKFDPFEYYWKEFANIGEQPIRNQELFCASDGLNYATFGYTPRYAEYRYQDDQVHGEFRTSLDFWHMGRIFSARPTLSQNFIECIPTDRIFAVTDANVDKIYAHVFHQVKAKRPIPRFGVPSFNF